VPINRRPGSEVNVDWGTVKNKKAAEAVARVADGFSGTTMRG
jgi:hypothetical protein